MVEPKSSTDVFNKHHRHLYRKVTLDDIRLGFIHTYDQADSLHTFLKRTTMKSPTSRPSMDEGNNFSTLLHLASFCFFLLKQ